MVKLATHASLSDGAQNGELIDAWRRTIIDFIATALPKRHPTPASPLLHQTRSFIPVANMLSTTRYGASMALRGELPPPRKLSVALELISGQPNPQQRCCHSAPEALPSSPRALPTMRRR